LTTVPENGNILSNDTLGLPTATITQINGSNVAANSTIGSNYCDESAWYVTIDTGTGATSVTQRGFGELVIV
jgi:hypothetical protein